VGKEVMSSVFNLVSDLMEINSRPDNSNVPEAFELAPQSKSEWRQEGECWAEYQDGKLITIQTYPPDGVDVIPDEPKVLEPINEASVLEALERTCRGIAITVNEFRNKLDIEDIQMITSGAIPMKTARAYAQTFADESSSTKAFTLRGSA
jgi:hypothetical protein